MMMPGRMLKQALRSLFKKPATTSYPFTKPNVPENFRGRLKYYPEKCIGCMLCVKDCPCGAIAIKKLGDKKFQAEIDLDKCIYCAQCVDSCMKGALESTKEFELAQINKADLKEVYNEQNCPPSETKA